MSELLPCPFCGGVANTLHKPHVIDMRYSVGCNDDECLGFIGLSWLYKTEAEAVAAWNSRAERTCRNISGVPLKFRCSECGDVWGKPSVDEFKYCPNCGAKVRNE